MKTISKIFWSVILGLLLVAGIMILVQTVQEGNFATKMQGLDMDSANGTLVAGYDVASEQFTRKYIPKELVAKKQEDVGYLVKITYSKTGAAYTGGHYVSGTAIHTEFVDCDTGKILFEHDFEPYFPHTVSSKTKSVSVDPDVVERWITHVYPHWPADKDVGHDYGPDGCWFCGQLPDASAGTEAHVWQDATCTAPKTCKDCGTTEGNALGHNFMPDVCTRCGMAVPNQDASTETEAAAQNPEADAEKLIIGKWNLDFIMGGDAFDTIPFNGNITLQLNKDHSAFITIPDEKYSYEWVYNYQYFEEDDPNKCVYCYLLIDDAGNEIYFYHYYDNAVQIFTEDYSVFFTR